MGSKNFNVLAEVVRDSVVGVRLEVPDVKSVIKVNEDQIVLKLPDEPSYEEYQENYRQAIEEFAAVIGSGHDPSENLEDDWSRVFDKAKKKGRIVLMALYEHGVDTDEGLIVKYKDIKDALEEEGQTVKGKTMPGIIRGINTKIRDYVSGVEDTDEAKKILKQTWDDDGDKCRLLVNERDGRLHAKAFQAAMEGKEV